MFLKSILTATAILGASTFGAAAATLDANHSTTDNPNNNVGLGIVNTSVGQTFTATGNGILQSVQFSILNLPTSPATGDVGFDIRGLTGGAPDPDAGDALFSSIVANSDIAVLSGNPYTWSVISVDVLSANIAVATGDIFSFVLSTVLGQEFAVQTDYLDAYSGGQRWSQIGDSNPFGALSTADLSFSTTIAPSAVPLPASLPLLLAGFAGLTWIGRRRKAA